VEGSSEQSERWVLATGPGGAPRTSDSLDAKDVQVDVAEEWGAKSKTVRTASASTAAAGVSALVPPRGVAAMPPRPKSPDPPKSSMKVGPIQSCSPPHRHAVHIIVIPGLLSYMASYDVASGTTQALTEVEHQHHEQHQLELRQLLFLQHSAVVVEAAVDLFQGRNKRYCPPRHSTHLNPRPLS